MLEFLTKKRDALPRFLTLVAMILELVLINSSTIHMYYSSMIALDDK